LRTRDVFDGLNGLGSPFGIETFGVFIHGRTLESG